MSISFFQTYLGLHGLDGLQWILFFVVLIIHLSRAYSNTYRKRTGPRLILRSTVTVRVTTGGDLMIFQTMFEL